MGPGEGLPRATARRAGWIARSRPWDGTEADFTVGLGIGPPPPFPSLLRPAGMPSRPKRGGAPLGLARALWLASRPASRRFGSRLQGRRCLGHTRLRAAWIDP
jgi:hypothetical protein